jgi:O-antigen/teichoic acid export membrane protein
MNLLARKSTLENPHELTMWHGFLTKVGATLGTRGFVLVASFVSSVVTSRYLGPGGRGTYAVLTVTAGIAIQLGNFGLHAANTFFLGQDRSLRGRVVANSAWLSGTLGLLLVAILVACRSYVWNPADDSFLIYYAAIATVPFGLFYTLALNIRLGLGQIQAFNSTELVVNIGGLIAVTICLIVLHLGVGSLIIYSTVFNAMAALWLFSKLRVGPAMRFDFALFARMFRYGIKAYVAAIFAFLVLRFDLLMVSKIVGPEGAGIYSIAVQIADVLYLLPVSIGLVLFPELSAMKSGAWDFAKRTARVTSVLLAIATAGVWLVAPTFIQLAYGPEFSESAVALKWLLPGIWALGVNSVFMNYFAGTGMPIVTVISPAIAFATNVGLNYLLIPIMGISGASLASTICYSIMLLCSGIYLRFHRKT